ncbi:unnamed protein product [Allacma fusca]|uniref:CRAL-TRIO domain-containing protein n=1 Tax=Allacma fusca TaxID=39272 RepID=A0A8J2PE89_9HEXA|nr:unnamed protein product [Allacma fusca]
MSFPIVLMIIVLSATLATSHNLTDSEALAYVAPVEIQESLPYYLSGYDEDGAPLWVFELGKWDVRKFVDLGGELFNAMDIYADQMFLTFRESGRNSTAKQFLAICDMDKFSIRQAGHFKTVQFLISKFVRLEQIVSVGALKQAWIINANFLWESVWQLGSPLLGALANSIDSGSSLTEEERNILDFEAPQELQEAFPYYLSGYDESGAPIWIFQLGSWDIRKYVEIGGETLKNVEKVGKQMFLRFRESSRNRSEVNDGERTGYISILDMDGYPFRQIAHVQTLKFTLHMIQELGETVKSHDLKFGYVLNANQVFMTLWDSSKHFVGELHGYIEIYGNNPSKWKAQLLKQIPQDQLPEKYGGNKEHKFVKVYG